MSEAAPISAAGGGQVRAAIARAAEATGVDFAYLLAQAKLESGLDPSARASTSSASGLYQFTKGTWLATLDRHGADHGMGWAGDAIAGGRVADPAMRAHILALRGDAGASALMAAELASDNRAALAGQLGREPDAAELYLAHFLGAGGAGKFLKTLAATPDASAAALLPDAAQANRTIFYDKGAPRSVAGVMALLRGKVDRAMEAEGVAPASLSPLGEGVGGWGFNAAASTAFAASAHPNPSPRGEGLAGAPPRPSMAETLRDAFGLAQANTAPAHVRSAYASLKGLGL